MWILATLFGLILFLVLLLAIPFDLRFYIANEGDRRSKARVEWLYGLIGKDLKRKAEKPKPKKKKKKKKGGRRKHIRPLIALVRSNGFVSRCIRFLRDILRVANVRELSLDVRLGLGDPADTAMLFAAVAPAAFFADRLTPIDVRARPDFVQACLKGRFSGDLRVVPIKLLGPIVFFIFSPTTIRAIKSMVMAYRK